MRELTRADIFFTTFFKNWKTSLNTGNSLNNSLQACGAHVDVSLRVPFLATFSPVSPANVGLTRCHLWPGGHTATRPQPWGRGRVAGGARVTGAPEGARAL